jgi:hypothetical protein
LAGIGGGDEGRSSGVLSDPLFERLSKGVGPFCWLLGMAVPGGNRLYGATAYASAENGMYTSRVLGWGALRFDASERTGKLASVETTVTIDDSDHSFSKLIESEAGNDVRGSIATIRLAHPEVSFVDWYPGMYGIITGWSPLKGLTWGLRLRVNDRPLMQNVPRQWIFTRGDWPNAKSDVIGKVAPWIYGKHSALGLGDTGMVPTYKVNTVDFTYLISACYLKSVDRVYKGGVLQIEGTGDDYTVGHPIVNGRQYTCVTFKNDPLDAAVTADVQGIETVGDGTGTLITNPATQLAHLLVNTVWNTYQSGAWFAYTTAPILLTAGTPFAEAATWLNVYGVQGSRYLFAEGLVQGISLVDEWCGSNGLRAFWTSQGLLTIRPVDHRVSDLYISGPLLRQETSEIGDSFSLGYDDTNLIDNVSIQYLHGAAANQYLYAIEVGDAALTEFSTASLSLPWSAAYA